MGDVVGQDLMLVGAAVELGEAPNGAADDPVGQVDGVERRAGRSGRRSIAVMVDEITDG